VKFPAQLLSILRLSQSEHAHAIPVDMIGGYGHVAFVLDALLYYLKRSSPGKGVSCVLQLVRWLLAHKVIRGIHWWILEGGVGPLTPPPTYLCPIGTPVDRQDSSSLAHIPFAVDPSLIHRVCATLRRGKGGRRVGGCGWGWTGRSISMATQVRARSTDASANEAAAGQKQASVLIGEGLLHPRADFRPSARGGRPGDVSLVSQSAAGVCRRWQLAFVVLAKAVCALGRCGAVRCL
jgi:hypothetical protein